MVRELGTLGLTVMTKLHNKLLAESGMYRVAQELGLVGLMSHMMLKELDDNPSLAFSSEKQ